MPPRARTTAPSDAFHGSFDPGVTGRRTGVAPPLKVRRMSNGIEAFSDYFASPRKDPSVSPLRSPNQPSRNQTMKRVPSRPRNDRPDLFHEIGERGRKTGISPPKNVTRDENGFEEFDNYLIKATEQTNKAIAKERRRSMRRKSISQALHARKLSTATFVDDDDEDEEFEEESISLATPVSLHHETTRSAGQDSALSNQVNSHQSKFRSRLSNPADQSTRTRNDSDLIDFDVVPEGPIHSNSRSKSQDDQPMTVQDDDDDDVQDSVGMVVNEYDDGSVGSDGFDPAPPPAESPDGQVDNPVVLEDILEDDENEQDPAQGPSAPADSGHQPESKKRRKSNPHPPPVPGIRRGLRHRLQRLAHWRGEKVVYGRSTTPDGNQRVIGMLDVVRVPEEKNLPFAQRRNRRKPFTKVKSESVAPIERTNPEEDLDSETRPNGIVYSYTKQKDCERSVVCTKKMAKVDVEDQAGVPNAFKFQRLFKGTDFVAGGLLFIPVGGGKPLKPAKDNFYFFTVLEGAVSVHVHRTTFVVAPFGVFWIPRGNVYSIQNIGQRTAKLTFSQARRATGDEQDLDSEDPDEEEHSIDLSVSNNATNIDHHTSGMEEVVANAGGSNENTKSKRRRPEQNPSENNNKKKVTNKKKPTKQKQVSKKQNNKRKDKQPIVEEEEEEEEEEEAQTS